MPARRCFSGPPVVGVVTIGNVFLILLAELESLFQKTNAKGKLTLLLNDFGFYCTFCTLQ